MNTELKKMSVHKIHLTAFPSHAYKENLIKNIKSLGSDVLDPNHNQFNEECTHVVVYNDEAKPTERILAALAAGNYKSGFITALFINFVCQSNVSHSYQSIRRKKHSGKCIQFFSRVFFSAHTT